MTRQMLIACLLMGCAEPVIDPHKVFACDPGWAPLSPSTCEAGCVEPPDDIAADQAIGCDAELDGAPLRCAASFDWYGSRGCCVVDSAAEVVRFAECGPS